MMNMSRSRASSRAQRPQVARSLAVYLAMLMLLLVASALVFSLARLDAARDNFTRTLKAIDTLHLVQVRILAAENVVQAFALRGQEGSLLALDAAQQDIPEFLAVLEELLADDPQHFAALEAIRPLIAEQVSILEAGIEPGSDSLSLLVRSQGTHAVLDQRIRTLETMLDAQLIDDFDALKQAETLSLWVSGMVAFLGLGGGLAILALHRSEVDGS